MYEIWLALNIMWEMALAAWPMLLIAAVAWVLVMLLALAGGRARWRAALPTALIAAVVVAGVMFVLLPGISKSSLSEMRYALDWLNHLAMSAGFGALGLLYCWPLLAMRAGAAGQSA